MKRPVTKPRAKAADKAIGIRIEHIRKQQKVSRRILGNALGVTHQQIEKYEKGINRISASQIKGVADYFEIPVSLLLGESTNEAEALYRAWRGLPQGVIRQHFLSLMQTVGRIA